MSGSSTFLRVALLAGGFAGGVSAQNSQPVLNLTAVTANVAGAPDNIRIALQRWSTDAERDRLMAAWNMTGAGRGGRGGGRAGGRGGARAGRAGEATPDPAAGDDDAPAPRSRPEEAAPATPEGTLAAALQQTPSLGYLWSSEVAGYAIRYAGKVAGADGVERIILLTDRRLGKTNNRWKPPGNAAPSPYDFSVIELRLNAKGEGEGKISLVGKVAPDSAAKIVALENYGASPVMLTNVKPKQR